MAGVARWSPDHNLIARQIESEAEARIHVLDAKTTAIHSVWRGEEADEVGHFCFSMNNSKLAIRKDIGAQRTSLEVWDVDREETISSWIKHGPSIGYNRSIVVWSPDGTRIAVSSNGEEGDDGSTRFRSHVYVIDAQDGETVFKHLPGGFFHAGSLTAIAWAPDGRRLALGSSEGLVEVLDVDAGRKRLSVSPHGDQISAISWSPDGHRVATASVDRSVKVIEPNGGQDLITFQQPAEHVRFLTWSPDGKRLAAATETGELTVWDAAKGYEFAAGRRRRGELAWAYFRLAEDVTGSKSAYLRKALDLAPNALGFWRMRGAAQARLGHFDQAAEEFANALSSGPRYAVDAASYYAYALLGGGQLKSYHNHCRDLMTEFADTKVPSNGGLVAWLCALAPADDVDTKEMLRLARESEAKYGHRSDNNRLLVVGAALYRDGKLAEAERLLTDLVAKLDRTGSPASRRNLVCARYFLAMTRQRLGHPAQAKRYLHAADSAAEEVLVNGRWTRRIDVQRLAHEARELID